MEYLGVGCASLIGWVFLASAISKLRHFGEFTRSLPALAPARPGHVRPLAMTVVAAEAAVPALLLVPAARGGPGPHRRPAAGRRPGRGDRRRPGGSHSHRGHG